MKNVHKKNQSNIRSSKIRSKVRHKEKDISHWYGILKNIPCFIVGNGPSLKKVNTNLLKDYFTIGINRCFLKIDPTILIWQDLALWMQEKDKVKKLQALKYCRAGSDLKNDKYYHFKLSGSKPQLPSDPTTLYGRGSSGSLAFQFAHLLGCDPIVLLGMDCRYTEDGRTNFYGNNSMHRQHTLPFCKKALKWIRDVKHGRTIINCSKNKVFEEKLRLEDVIPTIKNLEPIGREKFNKILIKD